jgi:hypothetical protein
LASSAGAIAAFLLLPLAGCGSGATETVTTTASAPPTSSAAVTTSTSSPEGSATEFLSQADELCAEFNQKLSGVSDVDQGLQIVREGREKLDALEPPAELATRWNQYLAFLDDEIAAFESGDATEKAAANERKSQVALEMGLAECGTG